MPIKKSAKKALRQSIKRQKANLKIKKGFKDSLKKAKEYLSQGKTAEAKKGLPFLYKKIDKAAKAGLIKKNNANRKKARITRAINRAVKS